MAKRITAKIDEYQDAQGQTKGKYVDVGVVLSNANGEYIILNPTIDLAGVMIRQRMMNPQKAGKGVMCSIFSDEPQQQAASQPVQQPTQQDAGFADDDIPF